MVLVASILTTSSLALPYIRFIDTWSANGGSTTDRVIWVDEEMKPEILGITDMDADMVCYDWNDDSSWDNCYWDSNGCGGGGCNANSCNYYSIPNSIPSNWKAGCDIDGGAGGCRIGEDVPSRICWNCDGIDTSSNQKVFSDAVMYYDCDNSNTNRYFEHLNSKSFWIVKPKKYDCDAGAGTTTYDFEGDASSVWVDIIQDINCPSYRVCDENQAHDYHADQLSYSNTGSITHPCTLEDGSMQNHVCTSNNQCYSGNCGADSFDAIYCDYDGSDGYTRQYWNWQNTCGGAGTSGSASTVGETCTLQMMDVNYVCDDGLSGIQYHPYSASDYCKKKKGTSCNVNSDCWNDNGGIDCVNGYCSQCGDGWVSPGENVNNCPQDYCSYDGSQQVSGINEPGDGTCVEECFSAPQTSYYSAQTAAACDGEDITDYACVDSDTRVQCCTGTPQDCNSGEFCMIGNCYTCSNLCNNICQRPSCYGYDPDCDAGGGTGGMCGDGVCCQEDVVSCPQDCATYCDGSIDVVVEDRGGAPLKSLSVYHNGNYVGSTDTIGTFQFDLTHVMCDANQEVMIKCSDNATVCEVKQTQIDLDGDTDNLYYDCTICSSDHDLYAEHKDVYIDGTQVTIGIHSVGISDTFGVSIYEQNADGTYGTPAFNPVVTVNAGSVVNVTFILPDLKEEDYLHIYIDTLDVVKDEDNSNNYLFSAVKKEVKASLDINLDPSFSVLEDVIYEYISSFADIVPYAQSQIHITVGQTFLIPNIIVKDGRAVKNPYGGAVHRYPYGNGQAVKPSVQVYGNRIEGTIAAVKRMINAKGIFLDETIGGEPYESIIDDYDTLGISVYDQLHNNESQTYFNQNNEGLKQIVRGILFDNNFEVAVKPVKTLDTTSYGSSTILRVKNVNSDFSEEYMDAVGISDKPVVMSRGIHSNLFVWEKFGKELAADGQDVWLIEMVGGPDTDEQCGVNCPNYTFADLKDYYWPALIAGVQEYSGKNKIDYVGFSLGCSAALESLKNHQQGENNIGYYFDYNSGQYVYSDLASDPVDTFIGIGCPGNFSKLTTFMRIFNMTKNDVFDSMNSKGISHLTGGKLRKLTNNFRLKVLFQDPDLYKRPNWGLLYYSAFIPIPDHKMSREIYEEFYNWINDPNEPNLGKDVNLNNTLLIQGKATGLSPPTMGVRLPTSIDKESDVIVPAEDMRQLCENVNSANKYYVSFNSVTHGGLFTALPGKRDVKDQVKFFLKEGRIIQNDKKYKVNQNCTTI